MIRETLCQRVTSQALPELKRIIGCLFRDMNCAVLR